VSGIKKARRRNTGLIDPKINSCRSYNRIERFSIKQRSR
jgi:hypothetical protein